MRQITGSIAENDRKNIVRRLKLARDRNSIKLGRRVEGRKAFDNEKVIARVKDLREQGLNYPAIAKKLDSEGHKTQTGEPRPRIRSRNPVWSNPSRVVRQKHGVGVNKGNGLRAPSLSPGHETVLRNSLKLWFVFALAEIVWLLSSLL